MYQELHPSIPANLAILMNLGAAAMNLLGAAAMRRAKDSLLRHRVLLWRRSGTTGANQPFRRPPIWYRNLTRFSLAAGVSSATVYYFKNRETVPFTNRTRFVLLSPTLERWLTNMLFKYHDVLPPTHPDSVRVKLVSDKIIKAAVDHNLHIPTPIPPFHWEVVVVRDKEWTCHCHPGGKIVISTGTLQYLSSDIDLAWWMGHEVGHVIARHSSEKITKLLGFKLMYIVLLRRLLYLPFLIEKLSKPFFHTKLSNVLFRLPLSRRMEIEADYIGLMLLASAGYYPGDVQDMLAKESQTNWTDGYNNYRSTHPSFQRRSQLASQAMEEALAIYWKVISTCNDDEL